MWIALHCIALHCILLTPVLTVACCETAGSCAHKSESAVEFKGKQCKVEKTVGFSKSTSHGGGNRVIDLDLSKLTMTKKDDSSSASSTATAGK